MSQQPIVVRQLSNPSEDEINRGSAVLAAAFAPRPGTFSESMAGGNPDLSQPFYRAQMRGGAVGGELWVAGFGPTDISAVAIWFGPGQTFLGSEEQREAGWNQLQSQFTPELRKWWSDYLLPRVDSWTESCLGNGAKLNSWHLLLLGTNPDHHHKGLAAALIKAVETKANNDDVMMCLETSNVKNISFYKHFGFTVRGDISIIGSAGEVTMTCLSKP
ncbi:hypothetical protein C8J57DRAFT_90190 [Mycena rebaudengoi]|nr:hypothetical protein C8J57DRAFT_90190 [Mycena rebaudengoi]